MRLITAAAVGGLCLTAPLAAQDDQREAVRRAALDYLEGFYEGDSTKLLRSVSPEVLKFGFSRANDGTWRRHPFPWQNFLDFARGVREGRNLPPAGAPRGGAWWGMDSLWLAREAGRWRIPHVRWQGPPAANRR